MRLGPNEFPTRLPNCTRNTGRPYALIKRGGQAPGKRPFTKLAYLTNISSPDGGRTLVIKGYVRQGNGWTKRAVSIDERDVVAQWCERPAPATIAAKRQMLAPVGAFS